MTYTSFPYFVFLACLAVVYFVVPRKGQWIVLLAASYIFYYMAASVGAIVFLLVTTVSIFFIAKAIGGENQKQLAALTSSAESDEKIRIKRLYAARKKRILIIGLLLNFGILAVLKYSNFVVINVGSLFNTDIGLPHLLLPLGISFYTFQSAGYLIDVYRGRYEPDGNIFKFALFTSFFPQIVQGPISRHDQLAHQLYAEHKFDWTQAKHGVELILWGLFKKLVIADRAVVFVNYALGNSESIEGFQTAAGCLIFMAYVYADFSGGIDISRGICQVLGIEMTENFRRPHFSFSVSEYWRRWHITLGAWMRDYIFYSITLSKTFGRMGKSLRGKLGSYWAAAIPACIGMGITFMVVGIWHGAAWKFIAFGAYNGFFIMIETLFLGRLADWNEKHGLIKTKAFSWRLIRTLFTFFIIYISKFFAMSYGAGQAVQMIKSSFSVFNPQIFFDGTLYTMGLSEMSFKLLLLAIFIFFVVSLMQENGIRLREALDRQNLVFRWFIYFAAVFSILIFGVYGPDIDPAAFVYQQF